MLRITRALLLSVPFLATPGLAQNKPAVEWRSLMNANFAPSGVLLLDNTNLFFPPENLSEATLEVLRDGEAVESFGFSTDYRKVDAQKVFANIAIAGMAQISFEQPGEYTLQFKINGEVATRFSFSATKEASDDPFHPASGVKVTGPWSRTAYLRPKAFKDKQALELVYWRGSLDLLPNSQQDHAQAQLVQDGKLIAHSKKKTSNLIADSRGHHYEMGTLELYQPHEEDSAPNAVPFAMSQLDDGEYELNVLRLSDQSAFRQFAFSVAGGKIQHHARSALDYEPHHDLIVPRVLKEGTTMHEHEEVFWLLASEAE